MGGDIKVKSELGSGSCFTATIQVVEAAQSEDSIEKPQSVYIQGIAVEHNPITILVVEDKQVNRQLLKEILRPIGFVIKEACNGEEALNQLELSEPELILMDMKMPKMDGYEATKRIRAQAKYKTLPIIAVTANAFSEDRTKALALGCNDFLSKPFKNKELLQMIGGQLNIRYTYADKPAEAKEFISTDTTKFVLSPQVLSQISSEWLDDFTIALENLHTIELQNKIDELENEGLKQLLLGQVHQFDYNALEMFAHKLRQGEGNNKAND